MNKELTTKEALYDLNNLTEDSKMRCAFMSAMHDNIDVQDDPMVGSFWYDPLTKECYGVYKVLASDVPFQDSSIFNKKVKTGRILHKDIWKKEQYRQRDNRFNGDYTQSPRGRVFELENGEFIVCTGNWINDYPEAREEIVFEFQLPVDNTKWIVDSH